MADLLQNYEELDPLKRGKLFRRVKEQEKISYQKIAKKINKSPAYIVNSVRLLKLPVAIKDGLLGGLISEGHARALISIEDQRECVDAYKEILRSRSSVREAEELVRQKKKENQKKLTEKEQKKLKGQLEKIFQQEFEKVIVKRTNRRITVLLYK